MSEGRRPPNDPAKLRHFWLCAVYRITHDDWIFRWVESDKQPHWAGVAVFDYPLTIYNGEDPAEKFAAIPFGPAPPPPKAA